MEPYHSSSRFNDPRARFIERSHTDEAELTAAEEAIMRWFGPKMKASQPKLDDFAEVSTPAQIERDKQILAQVKQAKAKPEVYQTEHAKLLEMMIYTAVHDSEWFGPDGEIVQTTEFDDRINHTDLVAEWPSAGPKPVRLAIDVTTNVQGQVYDKKVSLIKNSLQQREDGRGGRLTTIGYLDSPVAEKKLMYVQHIPRVIIGCDQNNVRKLAEIFIGYTKDQRRSASQELQKHFLAVAFLTQIHEQLLAQLELVKDEYRFPNTPSNRRQNIYALERVERVIARVLREKKRSLSDSERQEMELFLAESFNVSAAYAAPEVDRFDDRVGS